MPLPCYQFKKRVQKDLLLLGIQESDGLLEDVLIDEDEALGLLERSNNECCEPSWSVLIAFTERRKWMITSSEAEQ